tara:strand:+ start:1353 stop:2795 length:1443 start_codon:yes stop_codon:yes gene_type:complete
MHDDDRSEETRPHKLMTSDDPAFPTVSGTWKMEIHWQRGERTGKVDATAIINQSDWGIDMQVYSTGSDSRTILARPSRELSGRPVIHYMYEVEPKAMWSDAVNPYKGAAILRLNEHTDELSGNYWTSQLSKGFFKLSRESQAALNVPQGESVDVLLITALAEEFAEARAVFGSNAGSPDGVAEWLPQKTPLNDEHLVGSFFVGGQALFRIALAKPSRMGSVSTSPVATNLTNYLQPKCLVMCGVCAGNPSDVELGDLIVSELAYQYDEGKREKDEFFSDIRQARISKEWHAAAQSLDPRALPSFGHPNEEERKLWLMHKLYQGFDPRLLPARKRYFADGEWSSMLVALEKSGELKIDGTSIKLTEAGRGAVERSLVLDVDPPKYLPFAIKAGPIASGNIVVKDGVTWDMLKRTGVRTVLGLEMEAATIGEVAKQCGIREWIVIKGVMDHADPNKADRFKSFAARASAEALRNFLIGRFSV